MKTPDDYSISLAYSYKSSKELSMYYDDSAKDYDDFAKSVGYVLPRLVAEKAAEHIKNPGVIVDIGCGTGLLGVELNSIADDLKIHGVDISSQMICCAYNKRKYDGNRHYEKLFLSDMTCSDAIDKNKYNFMVSSGTFTKGHLDGGNLSKLIDSMMSDSFAVFSVKSDHFNESGFMKDLKNLEDNNSIKIVDISEVDSYENSNYTALSKIVSIKIHP